MKELIDRIMHNPVVAHIMAALDRYNRRRGPQFAAAVTYFSVLSMVPILMFAFAMLGMTLTVLRPDLLDLVKETVVEALGQGPGDGQDGMAARVITLIEQSLANWRGVFGVALVTAAYSGSKWVGNLKKAFRVMWRDKFTEAHKPNFVLELVENLLTFLGLLLSIAIAFGVTSAGGTFSHQVIDWLDWNHIPGISLLLRLVSIGLVLVASWVLFAFLFTVLPGESTTWRPWLIGTAAGAVLLTALQQLAGLLIGVFSQNRAGQVFGSVIILMLVFNVLATIILMIAAWVGTDDTWRSWLAAKDRGTLSKEPQDDDEEEEEPADDEPVGVTLPSTPRSWAEKRSLERWAARKSLDDLRAENFDPDNPPESAPAPAVPQDVAARSVRVGMGVGWGVGAATGIGMGAAVAALIGWLTRR